MIIIFSTIFTATSENKKIDSATSEKEEFNESDDVLPLVYDAEMLHKFWRKRPLEIFKRSLEIIQVVLPYVTKLFIWEIFIRGKIVDHEGLQVSFPKKLGLNID